MKLFERQAAVRLDEAHLLGNGRMGASVYGGVPFEEILINDDTLWSGRESYRVNEEFYDRLQQARTLALSGEDKAAEEIINSGMEGSWTESYMPLASAHIAVGQKNNRRTMDIHYMRSPMRRGPVTDYTRTLDLDTATETVEYTRNDIRYRREYFVSYDRQLIYARLSAEGGPLDFAFSMDSRLRHTVSLKNGQMVVSGRAPDHAEPNGPGVRPPLVYLADEESDSIRFAAAARVVDTDGQVICADMRIYVNDATYAVIAIAAGTNYAGYSQPRNRDVSQVIARLERQLDNAGDWQTAHAEHLRDYQALYGRVKIDLGEAITASLPTSQRLAVSASGRADPSLSALLAQYGRYLLIAGSRPGSEAETLQGIWNDRTDPYWSSNYTTNINVQMNYWPAEQFNLSECHEPMLRLTREIADSGRRVARDYYHLDGWVTHHNIDLWRMANPACEEATWYFWPFGGVWMCQHLWTHYLYTKDETFLRETVWPVLKEAARFVLGFLCEDNGRLTTAPSTSPENKHLTSGDRVQDMIAAMTPDGENTWPADAFTPITKGSAMDLTMVRELFGNVLTAAELLQEEDRLTEALQAALNRLEPLKIGRYGALQEWHEDYDEQLPGMGHMSHLYGVYPAWVINERDCPELYEAARLAFQRRMAHGGGRGGFPIGWAMCMGARFHDRTLCTRLAAESTKELTANLMLKEWMQLDCIFGYSAGIGEMLLQSHNGYIELLPAPAYGWVDGSFSGMRAWGGFECDAAWKRNALTSACIRSDKGGECAVRAKGLKGVCLPDGSVQATGADGILRFDTQPGGAYRLIF